jgi:PAS domain S-box-containing protein
MIRVLYVDDEPVLLDLCRRYLERTGDFSVDTVESGFDALARLEAEHYDIVVADYQMPDMNGIELLRQIRDRSNLPFVLFTGRGREEVAIEAFDSGADSYLQKGGDPRAQFAELAHKCRQSVLRRTAERALREREQQYRTLFDSATDAILVIRERVIIQANARALDLYGRMTDQVLGGNPIDWSPPTQPDGSASEEAVVSRIGATLAGSPQAFEWEHLDREGQPIFVEISLNRISFGGDPAVQAIIRDVTERRHAAEALRHSEEMYRILVEHAEEGVFIIQDRRFAYVNQAIAALVGYQCEDLLGLRFEDLVAPDDRAQVADYHDRRIRGAPAPSRYHLGLVHRDGVTRIPVSLTATRITYLDRPAIMGMIRSMIEEDRAEALVKELLDAFPGIALLVEPDGRLLAANQTVLNVWDRPGEDLSGSSIFDIMGDEVEAGRRRAVDEAVRSGRAVRHRDRRKGRCQDALITPLIGDDGTVARVAIFSRDVTAEENVKAALNESAARARALLDASSDHVIMIDTRGTVLDLNRSASAKLGIPAKDLRGRSITTVTLPEDQEFRLQLLSKVVETGQPVKFEQDHSDALMEYSFEPIADRDGRVREVAIFVRDITSHRKATEALLLATKKLSLLSQITRHEIANQLTTLRGRLSLLEQKSDSDRNLLNGLERNCEAIARVLDFMGEYETIGRLVPVWKRVEETIRSASSGFDTLEPILDASLEPWEVFADPMIDRVFVNLFENASRYAGPSPRLQCTASEDDEGLLIAIRDDGPGVPPDLKERIFEQGYGRNTGFGLYLSRECLGITGLLLAESGDYGHGARFEIRVPPGAYRLRFRNG